MREFFSVYEKSPGQFRIFSSLHITMLVTICVIALGIIIFRKHLRGKNGFYRYLIAVTALVLEGLNLIWVVNSGKWDLKTTLPVELCELTLILSIVMLIWKSYHLFETLYFWGFIGSTLALIFPHLHATYRHFHFWAFMLSHSLNLIALLYMMSVEKYRPTARSIRLCFIVTNIYMALMGTLNYFSGSNYYYYYVFSRPAPNIPNPIMYTNSWFLRISLLEITTLFALLIGYLPFMVAGAIKNRNSQSVSLPNP